MREADLYRPVAKFLESRYNCARAATWTAGSGKDLAFPAGFGKRKPDVVLYKPNGMKPEVHLVEGKLLNVPTHGFEETFNQLDSFRAYADLLWAVFPAGQWASASTNHERWTTQLRHRGYGLLLVDGARVLMEFEAHANGGVDPACKKALLAQLMGDSDDPVALPALGSAAAEAAARAAARVAEVMTGPVRDLIGKDRKESTFTSVDMQSAKPYFIIGSAEVGSVFVQGDPFSTYIGDGRPVIWVWRYYGDLRKNEKAVRAAIAKPHPTDVYFFADNDSWGWVCRPLSDLHLETVKGAGYLGEFSLGRPLQVSDRTMKGIAADLKRMMAWARE